jgi:hypothetical protein
MSAARIRIASHRVTELGLPLPRLAFRPTDGRVLNGPAIAGLAPEKK